MRKKKWGKPMLIVLVRGGQERVLTICKSIYQPSQAPEYTHTYCAITAPCSSCYLRPAS